MKIESILFDLDGTLIDSSPGIEYSAGIAVATVMPQRRIPCLRSLIGPSIREVFRQALKDVEPETLEELERKFRLSYDSDGWKKSVVYDGVLETLSQLYKLNVKSLVVTNKPITPTRNILEQLKLSVYFDDVFSPDSKSPPFTSKAEAVSFAIAKHKLEVEKTLLVGDSKDDAQAAEECGIKIAAVSYGYGRAYLECKFPIHYVLPDFSHLLNGVGIYKR